jgi:hypothetical protein
MKLLNVFIGLLAVLVLALGAVVALLLITSTPEEFIPEKSPAVFSVIEVGTAAERAYAVYNHRGEGNLTIISLDNKPAQRVTVIQDSQAIQATQFNSLVDELQDLEKYGYDIMVTNRTTISSGVYVIPTGAIPAYVLFNLQQNSSNATIIYIGEKDLILSRGIKQQAWYNALTPKQRERIVVHETTLDEFMENGSVSLPDEILHVTWESKGNSTYRLSGGGLDTATIPLDEEGYVRIIYNVDELYGIYDSPRLMIADTFVNPDPDDIYPWQRSTLLFSLNKTNGTAYLSIEKDGKEISRELLRRVSDQNVFLQKLQYEEPGEYIIKVRDNRGTMATGLLHVYDLEIELAERAGIMYTFSVNVDGEPARDTDAVVSVGSGAKRGFYVNDGRLTIPAKLDKGMNTFNIQIYGTTFPVQFDNQKENLFEFYLTYGAPGLLLMGAVYFAARLSRRPSYQLRFGDSVTLVRQEMRIPLERAIDSFRRIRSDMNLGKTPITPQEFTVSLKRYLTNGADVTEGNVEEILKNLVRKDRLEGYRDYYQLKGEGDIKRNALRRMVREQLIQSGTMFTERNGKFVTKDYEIGFFGHTFSKKGIIIVEDKAEARRILSNLSDTESSKFALMRANDMVELVSIDRLQDVL